MVYIKPFVFQKKMKNARETKPSWIHKPSVTLNNVINKFGECMKQASTLKVKLNSHTHLQIYKYIDIWL